MKRICLLACLIGLAFPALSQEVLFEVEVDNDTVPAKFGKNLALFTHLYVGGGLVLGESDNDSAEIVVGSSNQFKIGVRHKWKITKHYAFGLDLSYDLTDFRLDQNDRKILPDSIQHDKEKINFNNLNLELYQRINFGRRGNDVGNFIDIGGYGSWAFSVKHHTWDDLSPTQSSTAESVKSTYSGLKYVNAVNYGLSARIGSGRYVAYGKYRLSDMFDEDFGYPELPRLVLGIEIGLFI